MTNNDRTRLLSDQLRKSGLNLDQRIREYRFISTQIWGWDGMSDWEIVPLVD